MTDWTTILHGEILNPKASLQVFYENTSRHTHKKEKKAKITKKNQLFSKIYYYGVYKLLRDYNYLKLQKF